MPSTDDMHGDNSRRQSHRDRDRDEALETRSLMCAALMRSGRPMRTEELARQIDRTRQQVAFAAGRWRAYFERNESTISLHRHLRVAP